MSFSHTYQLLFNVNLVVATRRYEALSCIDWTCIMRVIDLIRQKDVSVKYAIDAISKNIRSDNSRTSYHALVVLESFVKNCGTLILDEIGTKLFMDQFYEIIDRCSHDEVISKALDLIQTWAFAFRHIPKYRAINDCLNDLKAEGYTFPAFKESEAMLLADCAPISVDRDVHHRGQSQSGCVSRGPLAKTRKEPSECLAGSSAQQPQTVNGDIEHKLKEIEYLQLALAISGSETKKKTACKNSEDVRQQNIEIAQLAMALEQSEMELKKPNGSGNDGANNKAIIGSSADVDSSKQKARVPLKSRSTPTAPSQESICEICQDAEKKVAFLCGHRACSKCAKQITQCHICRKNITQRITLY